MLLDRKIGHFKVQIERREVINDYIGFVSAPHGEVVFAFGGIYLELAETQLKQWLLHTAETFQECARELPSRAKDVGV
jgi:hypothetical protein